jgi:formylglycine-generating enzyme required for sulfatase activity
MSSLADLPELVGFFTYSREDDEDSHGALSALRDRIQRELRGQLGRTKKTLRLWQDKEAIASGRLWEAEIRTAVEQSVFFIPIITPTVVRSRYCQFELDSFLAREATFGRDDLVFPILYIKVPALEESVRRENDPLLSVIAKRQYVNWCEFRHVDVGSTDVRKAVERFCTHICDALNRNWLSPEERKAAEEEAEAQRGEAERKRQEAEAQRRDEEARQKAAAAQARARSRADEERRRSEAEAKQRRTAEAESERRREGRIKVDAKFIHGAPDGWFKPGAGRAEWFKDHEHGPEMVAVPAGEFMMGSPDDEPRRFDSEGPLHKVKLTHPFSVGRNAVTRGEFAAFVNNTKYKMEGGATVLIGREWKHDPNGSWRNPGFGQDDSHPVVCVNWDDARAYVGWLSEATAQTYRLLSEAEWEYAARAGTMAPFWWGSSITTAQANYDGNFVYQGAVAKGEWRKSTLPVGSFEANLWGLYNVHGNVWEWCEDIWHENYNGAPADGRAWLQGGDAGRRVLRGGSWLNVPQFLRSANRLWLTSDNRDLDLGFRVARMLTT